MSNFIPPSSHNRRNYRNRRNLKGKYLLDKIDDTVYSTDNFILWNFYRSIFYGKPLPGQVDDTVPGPAPDWNVITFRGKVTHRKVDGKYKEVD